jgi:hypothetical protein
MLEILLQGTVAMGQARVLSMHIDHVERRCDFIVLYFMTRLSQAGLATTTRWCAETRRALQCLKALERAALRPDD